MKAKSNKKSKLSDDGMSSDGELVKMFTNEELYDLENSNLQVVSWLNSMGF